MGRARRAANPRAAIQRQGTWPAAFEITTSGFAFARSRAGLGFIRVDGFIVQRVANCYPVPQLGASSTKQGHHWIIENNVVRQVNGLGLDYGRRQTFLPYEVPADTPKLAGVGDYRPPATPSSTAASARCRDWG